MVVGRGAKVCAVTNIMQPGKCVEAIKSRTWSAARACTACRSLRAQAEELTDVECKKLRLLVGRRWKVIA